LQHFSKMLEKQHFSVVGGTGAAVVGELPTATPNCHTVKLPISGCE
jgi:hypothetical protein